jgi:hypothetical protein
MNLIEKLLYLVFLPYVAVSYILIPFTNDVRIFQGVARLVDYYGPFPMSLDAAWEIKPLGNRLINYLLYKAGTVFIEFGAPLYPIFIKTLAVLFVLGCCYIFARAFKDQLIPIFAISSLAMLTSMNFLNMQAEWYAVALSLAATGLLLSKQNSAYVLSGGLMFYIFLLKGITGLLIVPIICAVYLLNENDWDFYEETAYAFFGFVSAGLVFLMMCLTIFPHAIPDMLMSASLARVGQYSVQVYLNSMTEKLISITLYVPILLSGFILWFSQMATNKLPRRQYLAYLIMWLTPFAIIFIQGEFFVYHYFPLVFPAIIALCLEVRGADEQKRHKVYTFCILTTIVLWAIFSSAFGAITNVENKIWDEENLHAYEARSLFDIDKQPTVLFLDTGTGSYFFHVNSSCRFSGVLPVQRNQPNWNVSSLPAYRELYGCILNYRGRYIIGYDSWFGRGLPERAEIYQKIDREYDLIYNLSWDIYRRREGV